MTEKNVQEKIEQLQMLEQNPVLVLAWHDGKSKGTMHTIVEATKRKIPVEVVLLNA